MKSGQGPSTTRGGAVLQSVQRAVRKKAGVVSKMARGNQYHEGSIRQAAGLQSCKIANPLAKHKPPAGRSPRTSPAAAPATLPLLPLFARASLRNVHRLPLQLGPVQPRNRRFCLRFVRHLNEPETFGYAGKLVLGKADGRKLAEWFEKRPKLRLCYITR